MTAVEAEEVIFVVEVQAQGESGEDVGAGAEACPVEVGQEGTECGNSEEEGGWESDVGLVWVGFGADFVTFLIGSGTRGGL